MANKLLWCPSNSRDNKPIRLSDSRPNNQIYLHNSRANKHCCVRSRVGPTSYCAHPTVRPVSFYRTVFTNDSLACITSNVCKHAARGTPCWSSTRCIPTSRPSSLFGVLPAPRSVSTTAVLRYDRPRTTTVQTPPSTLSSKGSMNAGCRAKGDLRMSFVFYPSIGYYFLGHDELLSLLVGGVEYRCLRRPATAVTRQTVGGVCVIYQVYNYTNICIVRGLYTKNLYNGSDITTLVATTSHSTIHQEPGMLEVAVSNWSSETFRVA